MATAFKTLGAGNGFAQCLGKVDVSSFNLVKTLTLEEAMSIYWNLKSASVEATLDYYDEYFLEANITGADLPHTPVQRICNTRSSLVDYDTDGFGYSYVRADVENTIVRMYDGSTSNEDNFLGYGWSRNAINAESDWFLGQEVASIRIGSYGQDLDTNGYETQIVTVNGIEMVGQVYASGNSSPPIIFWGGSSIIVTQYIDSGSSTTIGILDCKVTFPLIFHTY